VEKLVNFFAEVATVTNAFYAAAVIFRNMIITEEATMVPTDGGEYYQLTSGKWWFGLPQIPTWLAWFGGNYTTEVSELFEHPMSTKFKSGLLLRAGDKPLNRDELQGVFPQLPNRLQFKYTPQPREIRAADHDPETVLKLMTMQEYWPADHIPQL